MTIKKTTIKRVIFIIILLASVLIYIPFISACTPSLTFGELVVSSAIDPETSKPSDEKNVFYVTDNNIFGIIEVKGAKADDSKRFSVKNIETGEIAFDKSESYSEEEDGFIEGYFYIEAFRDIDDPLIMKPGKYEISFYHNGGLIDTAEFDVLKPESKILEVIIANEIDEQSYAPINITNIFGENDIFYATIKTDYQIVGDYYEAKWFSGSAGESFANRVDIKEDYYSEGYIAFQLYNETPWPPDNYSVEIYHNGELEGIYRFEVLPSEEVIAEEVFTEGSVYINESYKFGFVIPEDWEVKEEDDGVLYLDMFHASNDTEIYIYFLVFTSDEAIPEEEYETTANEIFSDEGDQDWVLADEFNGEFTNENNIFYDEYQQFFLDENGYEVVMLVDFFKGSEGTYIMFSIVGEDYFEMYDEVYNTIVGSFDFL